MLPSKQDAVQNILYFASQARCIHGETIPNSLPNSVTTMTLNAPVGVQEPIDISAVCEAKGVRLDHSHGDQSDAPSYRGSRRTPPSWWTSERPTVGRPAADDR